MTNTRILVNRELISNYDIISLMKLSSMLQMGEQRGNVLLTFNQKSDDG